MIHYGLDGDQQAALRFAAKSLESDLLDERQNGSHWTSILKNAPEYMTSYKGYAEKQLERSRKKAKELEGHLNELKGLIGENVTENK